MDKAEVKDANVRQLRDQYVLGKTLGSGNFSTVKYCRHRFSRHTYAAKVFHLRAENADEVREMTRMEVLVMRALSHDNCLTLVDAFFSNDTVTLILELAEEGDFYDYVTSHERLPEDVARLFAFDIASALTYLHSLNIVHRDVKAENVLMFRRADESYILKLADFGLAEKVPRHGLSRVCGSPSYVAPEILEFKTYGLPVDVWSAGILFFFMLCKFFPFEEEDIRKKFEWITTKEPSFPSTLRDSVSQDARELILCMLRKNTRHRYTASDVLHDKWFLRKHQSKALQGVTDADCRCPHRDIVSTSPSGGRLKLKGLVQVIATAQHIQKSSQRREDAMLSRNFVEHYTRSTNYSAGLCAPDAGPE